MQAPKPPTTSVVIPAHIVTDADRGHLDEQLAALAEQDHDGEFDVVVADNRSAPGLDAHLATHPLRARLNLRYVAAPDLAGAAHARNVGADHASGDVLLFCDHDDRVHPDWMRRMLAFLDEGYDLICSAVEGSSLNADNPRGVADVPPPEQFQPVGVFAPVIVGTSMACRTTVYRKLGGMDVTYTANEDLAFGWRAHREGFRLGFLPAALVAYRYRRGFRPGYRQGRARGIGLARLNAEFPGNGLPEHHLLEVLVRIVRLGLSGGLTGEERGLLIGIAVGQLRGGLRYRTLHWW
ncbi:glycosyltransferase [Nocardia cyriacigeorgica]|uniref:Glycosyltransferase n=1 Tax=Nocardia cyriacigeorgica TaxID=135487 RepID=A0ABX0CIR2_9NOCA|nr:glycosyltransferase [Nocardia cyriacigeorgica]NEW56049.1 glycosyltransferase [Nocardia cyriacigeorgica]